MKQENKNKVYWVLVEPVNSEIAWFFLTKDGRCEYQNTIDNSCSWDFIPTKEQIYSMLDQMSFNSKISYYVVEPYLVPGKNKEFNIKVVEEFVVEELNSINEKDI
jgi:hypothetical protein